MEKTLKNAKIFYYDVIRKPVTPVTDSLVMQIRDTSQKLESAYSRFENETNEDLLDSIIYEIQSLKALYRYLLKRAKECGIECAEISVFGREVSI
ncbi:MAG: DUF2508 family protein [Clostridia bacterium]|nr:DUF2508 family protein [Clostridia bacterium]MBR3817832.1 DUF2508 family protein [Clostridia bacterium]